MVDNPQSINLIRFDMESHFVFTPLNRVSLKSVADTETASENHGAEGAFYYGVGGSVGDLIADGNHFIGRE